MEIVVVCAILVICCGFVLSDRDRLQRRAGSAQQRVAAAERVASTLESERRFLDAILNSIGDPIFVKDAEHRYIYVNEAKCLLTRAKRDAIIGKTDYDFPTPEKEQIDVFVKMDDIVIETGQENINEEALTDADGKLHTVVTRKSPYTDESGRRFVVGIIRDITQHKRIGEALKRAQAAYFAEAQKLSATGSFSWNIMNGEVFWSDETCRILGYDPSITPSIEAVMQRVHPEDVALVEEAIERARKEKRDFDFEHRLLMPDSAIKTIHVRAHALDGEPDELQFVGAVMDVTGHTEAYAALRRTEQRYRYLFDHMPVGLIQLRTHGRVRRGLIMERLRSEGVTDFAGYLAQDQEYVCDALQGLTIEAANKQAIRMLGARDANDLIAMPHAKIWGERPDTFRRILESRFHGKSTYQEETRIVALDGHPIDVLFTIARPERADSDHGIILYGFIDITETVQLRHERELESTRLAAIVSSSDDAIISKTLEGNIVSWNAGATNILGYTATDMIGQLIFRIIPPELHQEERGILTRLRRGERIHHYETTRIAKDGRHVEISMTLSPLFDELGRVTGASTVARDITESRQAEAELQRLRTELARVARVTTVGELTAAIAHEVNQPLTGVISSGNACQRWLAGDPPNLEAARRSIQRMIDDGNRASEVITRIRDMVRKSPPRRDALNINDTILEVLALLRIELSRNNVTPSIGLSNDLPLVSGDRIQLQQVILNLIMNAIEAMGGTEASQRKLLVASEKDGSSGILVTIEDSGAGLEGESLDHLFEAFFTTKERGMGMGLAVSQTILQAHGGRLWATPNSSKGATFKFTLPASGEIVA
jgi:PAS domain S-box-containing protein